MTKDEAAARMNTLGARGTPFFFMFDFDCAHPYVAPLNELAPGIYFDINGRQSASMPRISADTVSPEFSAHPIPVDRYHAAFTAVQEEFVNGNTYLLNLTQPTPVRTNLGFQELFLRARAKYRLLVNDEFLVFSPETFVTMRGSSIISRPMKGTIDARLPDAKKHIIDDAKEYAEHVTIVDLIRNDIGMVADRVRVRRFRYCERVHTNSGDLLQISSHIEGVLQRDWRSCVGDIMGKLLPAGSVTGAPKKKTVEIIRRVENYARGWYTGVAGIFDGRSLDSFVMIRYIERTPEGLVFKSGGGVTVYSDMDSEYRELCAKVYLPFTHP
ncbi:MAG: aminodeoxychorismate synthase component I [Spirochaetes bacterium]|nr:aminodeoxychorismate synthase component I [Spirochaetota bacterium]